MHDHSIPAFPHEDGTSLSFVHIVKFELVSQVQPIDLLGRVAVLFYEFLALFWFDDCQKDQLFGGDIADSFIELPELLPFVDGASFEEVPVVVDLLDCAVENAVEVLVEQHVAAEFAHLLLFVVDEPSPNSGVYFECFGVYLNYLTVARSSKFRVGSVH